MVRMSIETTSKVRARKIFRSKFPELKIEDIRRTTKLSTAQERRHILSKKRIRPFSIQFKRRSK